MPVATAKEERGDSAIELLVLLKERRHLMHASAPRRTSSSGSRCSACVRTGASAGRAGGLGEWVLRSLSPPRAGSARAVAPRTRRIRAEALKAPRSPSRGASAGGGCGSRVAAAGGHRVLAAVSRGDQHEGQDRTGEGEAGAGQERSVEPLGQGDGGVGASRWEEALGAAGGGCRRGR